MHSMIKDYVQILVDEIILQINDLRQGHTLSDSISPELKSDLLNLFLQKTRYEDIINNQVGDIPEDILNSAIKFYSDKQIASLEEQITFVREEFTLKLEKFKSQITNEIGISDLQKIGVDIAMFKNQLQLKLMQSNLLFPDGMHQSSKKLSIKRKQEVFEVDDSDFNEEESVTRGKKKKNTSNPTRDSVLLNIYGSDFSTFGNEEQPETYSDKDFYPVNYGASNLPGETCSDEKVEVVDLSCAYLPYEGKLISVGKGAIARVAIKDGDKIIKFKGTEKTLDQYNIDLNNKKTFRFYAHSCGTYNNGIKKGKEKVLDCYQQYKSGHCLASAINSSNKLEMKDGSKIKPNCTLIRVGSIIYLKAICNIEKGEELFFAYGNTFPYKMARHEMIDHFNKDASPDDSSSTSGTGSNKNDAGSSSSS